MFNIVSNMACSLNALLKHDSSLLLIVLVFSEDIKSTNCQVISGRDAHNSKQSGLCPDYISYSVV